MAESPHSATSLPELPDNLEPEALRDVDAAELEALAATLDAAERATVAAMAPYDRQLREIRARRSEVSTERRRRERAAQVAQRAGVREAAKSGGMPTLLAALAGEAVFDDATPLTSLRAFLGTGGEVGFGFARRPGTLAFTDGRRQSQARTWGEAAALYAAGWEPGSPGVPGVRVHLAGTLVERVVPAGDVVLEVSPAG